MTVHKSATATGSSFKTNNYNCSLNESITGGCSTDWCIVGGAVDIVMQIQESSVPQWDLNSGLRIILRLIAGARYLKTTWPDPDI